MQYRQKFERDSVRLATIIQRQGGEPGRWRRRWGRQVDRANWIVETGDGRRTLEIENIEPSGYTTVSGYKPSLWEAIARVKGYHSSLSSPSSRSSFGGEVKGAGVGRCVAAGGMADGRAGAAIEADIGDGDCTRAGEALFIGTS